MDDPYITMEECIQLMADKGYRRDQEFNWETAAYGTVFIMPPYPFNYLTRSLTMKEILTKFINEGKRKHEEMKIFIKEFRTTNQLLLKERSNLLSELKIEVNELSKVMSNVLVPKNAVKRVKTREKMTSEATPSKGDKDLMLLKSKFNDDETWGKSMTSEATSSKEDKDLMLLESKYADDETWYADFANYIVGKVVPPNWTFQKRKRFFSQVKTYFWEEPYAFKLCVNNIIRRCVAGSEILKILRHCHSGPTGGHHSAKVTARKVYQSGFYWPSIFKDANEYVRRCDVCQRSGNITSRNEMSQNNIQAFRTAYKTPTGCTPFRLVYGKAYHLPVEIEHKMYPGKLKLKWSGPNIVKTVYPYGAIEITDGDCFSFKVNGKQLKKYYEGNIDKEDHEVVEFENDVSTAYLGEPFERNDNVGRVFINLEIS
ncbi:reverse transcriptase domain-containing protein [Tanacetum coccineum]